MSNKRAWVTLATNDTYGLGALVLAHSLKKVNTKYDSVILITSSVTGPMRSVLQTVFHEVKEVNLLDSGDTENLRLLARPELGITFTKLHCWRLTQYEKCVFLDADTLVLQNCDDLFEREELSAAPDVGWPDCFNSGVFVFKPSEETHKSIIEFALANGSFDGGDQGLLNMYFPSWATGDSSKRLPFLYNLSSAAIYSYLPAFKWYGKGVKIIHFIGNSKPWQQTFNSVSRTVSTTSESAHLINFYQYWWNLFCAAVHPQLSPEMTRLFAHCWFAPVCPRNAHSSYRNSPSRNDSQYYHRISREAADSTSEATVTSTTTFRIPDEPEPEPKHYTFTDPWEEFEKISLQSYNSLNVSRSDQGTNFNEVSNGCSDDFMSHASGNGLNLNRARCDDGIHCGSEVDSVDVNGDCEIDCSLYDEYVDRKFWSKTERTTSNIVENGISSNALLPPLYPSYSEPVENSITVTPISFDETDELSVDRTQTSAIVNTGVAQTLSQMKLEEPTPEQLAQEDSLRRQNWEQGNIDYLGRDSFDNIWSKISQTISPDAEPASQQPEDAAVPPVTETSVPPSQPSEERSASVPSLTSAPPESTPAPEPKPESELAPTPTLTPVATADPPVLTAVCPAVTADPSAAVSDSPETIASTPGVTADPTPQVVESAPTSAEGVEVSPEAVPTPSDTIETSQQSAPAVIPAAESPAESQPQSEASEKCEKN